MKKLSGPSTAPKSSSVVYGPEVVSSEDYERKLGHPGVFPFTRGIYPEMYRRRLWTMRQYAGFGTAEQANARFHYLLSQGTSGLSIAFDLPTQIGLDSDDVRARGEVGRVGVAIDSLADFEILFSRIPLDAVSTSMTINASAPILLAMYLALARRQEVDWKRLRGTIQNDILKEYIARGTYIFPPGPSLRLITDGFAFCKREVPRWNSISVSGYHMREAGATAAQEVAFTIANAETYLAAALRAGLAVDDVAPQVSFFFSAHNDFFEEVAKYRAARRLWASRLASIYAAKERSSLLLRFHTQTAGSTLTAQQPDNNIARVTLQALAAVLGGTQSLHTNARDEAWGLPSEASAKLALRTQQILAHESEVTMSADPLGGSWYLEHLTEKLFHQAQEYMNEIELRGGVLQALEEGFQQREIHRAAYQYQREVETGARIVVGLNRFSENQRPTIQIDRLDPGTEEKQLTRLGRVRATRQPAAVHDALMNVKETAASADNLLPVLIRAVETYATVGEICSVLRSVFGEYRETVVF